MRLLVLCLALVFLASGCVSNTYLPRTMGEQNSGYSYIPIDPFPVLIHKPDPNGGAREQLRTVPLGSFGGETLFDLLPDNAVRVSVGQFDAQGDVNFGVGRAGMERGRYKVNLDYINVDTSNYPCFIFEVYDLGGLRTSHPLGSRPYPEAKPTGYVVIGKDKINEELALAYAMRSTGDDQTKAYLMMQQSEFNIPIYIGVGLRIQADVQTLDSDVNLTGLGTIGVEAEAGNLIGNLTLQTLGVNGKPIAAALPIQSEINRTTVQNAVVAIGSIKALLYQDGTRVHPRVVGMYLPFPADTALVNAVVSSLASSPPLWMPPADIPRTNR